MKQSNLSVTVREEKGKGAARRLRRAGMIPAVFYGRKSETVPLAVPRKEFQDILNSDAGSGTFLNLSFGGKKKSEKMALIKDLHTNPVTNDLIHADFYELMMDEEIVSHVPVRLVGKAKGVEMGGTLQPIRRELEVKCLPKDMPETIEIDVTDLGLGQSVHIDDVNLPPGVEVPHDVNFTVAVVLAPRGAAEAEVEAEAEAEGEAATEE